VARYVALIHVGSSVVSASNHLGGSRIIPPAHHIFQLSVLPRHQELSGRTVQPSVLELADGRTEFEQFSAQLQYLQDIIGHLQEPSDASRHETVSQPERGAG